MATGAKVGMILLSLIETASTRSNVGVLIAKTGPHTPRSYSGLYRPEPRGRHVFDGQISKTGKTTFQKDGKGGKNKGAKTSQKTSTEKQRV